MMKIYYRSITICYIIVISYILLNLNFHSMREYQLAKKTDRVYDCAVSR